jgi:hypothetical protein
MGRTAHLAAFFRRLRNHSRIQQEFHGNALYSDSRKTIILAIPENRTEIADSGSWPFLQHRMLHPHLQGSTAGNPRLASFDVNALTFLMVDSDLS